MSNQQLEIEGIGQQLATLDQWKIDNNIFTHKTYCEEPWSCWNEIECALDFADKYGMEAICVGNTEKQAVTSFCFENQINMPFWWN